MENQKLKALIIKEYDHLRMKYQDLIEDLSYKLSKKEMSWDLKTYEDWLRGDVHAENYGNKYQEKWVNFFVKNLDYIFHPQI